MASWQRRVRYGVAIVGIAFAVVVYLAIGERQAAAPAPRPERLDPKAILESAGAVLQQFREAKQDYLIEAERQVTYQGGATKLIGVTIKVRGRAGRDFVVSGREAQAGEGQKELEITGEVKLTASDGFEVTAESATFRESDAVVHVPGPVSFRKGGMSGSGVRMSYDQNTDVLTLAEEAHVEVRDANGNVQTDFTAGSAVLARQDNYLALEDAVHVLRGEQVLEADRGTAQLTENEEHITFIELRGNARVAGGGTFDAMSANDIDLDYTDDGQTLERVVLTGSGAIAMLGQEGAGGRQFVGESLDLTFAPDATLTSAVGRQDVRVDLPAAANTPPRSVKAGAFDAAGEPGKGLTSARFTEHVEYREEPKTATAAPRVARARSLQIALTDDIVTTAAFTGSVRFEEKGLQASAATAQYDPLKGTLRLAGVDGGGGPRVADEQVAIEADAIDVTLLGRQMTAAGNVKATLRPRTAGAGKLPGLLQQKEPATVNARTLDYRGATGTATFTGTATLVQGQTAVRGTTLTLDQGTGDLVATGPASSNLVFDTGLSIGRAPEMRYQDSTRRITYGVSAPPAPPGIVIPLASLAHISGPQGELHASRVDVVLGEASDQAERLEAFSNVSVRLDTRVATGDGLTYYSKDERYVMSAVTTTPVKVVEDCRETTGRVVTFFKTGERIIVDGNEQTRTQSRQTVTLLPLPGAAASQPRPRGGGTAPCPSPAR